MTRESATLDRPLTVIGIPLSIAPGGVITMRRIAPNEMLAMYSGSRFSSLTIVDLSWCGPI